MIPYFPPPKLDLGPLTIDSWTFLVLGGIYAGMEIARARAIREGLSVKVTVDTTLGMVAISFVFAHFVHSLGYHWGEFRKDPVELLRVWNGFSSIGGFIGAAIAVPLLLRLRRAPAWAYADTLAIGFIFGWALGRFGCFTAHDHKGRLSESWLAVDFPSGARHDLGLYEALIVLGIFLAFLVLDRKPRFHGFFTGWMMVLYAPARFLLDFLRVGPDDPNPKLAAAADTRHLGLTPAQYGTIALLAGGIAILVHRRRLGRQDTAGEADRDLPRRAAAPPVSDTPASSA